MPARVEHLIEEALLLPTASRTELVEAILESSAPSSKFIAQHMDLVLRRMDDVREGRSQPVPAEEAHRRVRQTLAEMS